MRYLAMLALACASCAPVPAVGIELQGDEAMVTQEERHKLTLCHRQGGCYIVTQAELAQAFQYIQQQTIEIASQRAAEMVHEARQSCRRSGT